MTADELNQAGREALHRGDFDQAIDLFGQACSLAPDWAAPFYNLGLTHKCLHGWPESFQANLAAFRLDPDDDPTVWNLAIAAVALNRWEEAGMAFRAIGLKVPDTPGPWDLELGLVPIRINPDHSGEVVWCDRLDPVRARIANVPLPDSGRRFGDLLLNDGEPRGYREYDGREVPVFDELEVLEESSHQTYELEVEAADERAIEDLAAHLSEHEIYLEDWTSTLRMLCKACSEGRPHDAHDHELPPTAAGHHYLGIAARSLEELDSLIKNWPRVEVLARR
ncbi:MAG: tetratricopeptide repeat protein [Candidatus Eremiobacteraeota bacterium]|nr:tetratricopeptide repeat protein [Candidatus Eremiobacteraeota bacterium]